MIFNEIYSAYYNAVAKIITSIIEGKGDEKTINKIVNENAFGESMLTVLPSLKSEISKIPITATVTSAATQGRIP